MTITTEAYAEKQRRNSARAAHHTGSKVKRRRAKMACRSTVASKRKRMVRGRDAPVPPPAVVRPDRPMIDRSQMAMRRGIVAAMKARK